MTKTTMLSEMRSVCNRNYLMTRFPVAVCQGTHQRIRIQARNTTLETNSSTFPCNIIGSILCISRLCGVEDEKTANLVCVQRGIWHVVSEWLSDMKIVRNYGSLSPPSPPLRMSNPLPWPWRKKDSTSPNQPNHFTAFLNDARSQIKALPLSVLVLATFTLGSATAMSAAMIYRRFGRRIRNVDWVTPTILNRKRWIKGVVTRSAIISLPPDLRLRESSDFWFWQTIWSVGDADNFRLYHTPALGYSWPIKFKRIPTQKGSPHISSLFFSSMNLFVDDLKNETLSIRIAGVDAPEVFCVSKCYLPLLSYSIPMFFFIFKASHFGKPAQPYAAESLTWLREKILGKVVYCQLLRKDQYSRIVSSFSDVTKWIIMFTFFAFAGSPSPSVSTNITWFSFLWQKFISWNA